MKTKLTLRIDDKVIERAKSYVKNQKISLSKVIEAYLDSLTRENDTEVKKSITPLVESLTGIIKLPSDFDFKKELILLIA